MKFHDGQAMTSADVVASLKRWGAHGSRGKLLFSNVSEVAAAGEHSVKLTFKSPFGPWKNLMAFINGGPAIYPARIASKAGKKPIDVKDYVGTASVQVRRMETEPPRRGWCDSRATPIRPVTPADTRASGRRTSTACASFRSRTRAHGSTGSRAGDYDYAESMPSDLIDELDKDPAVNVVLNGGPIFGLVFMNSKAGPLQRNFKLRQAIQAALNKEDALRVSIGPEKLWRANGSFLPKGQRVVFGVRRRPVQRRRPR